MNEPFRILVICSGNRCRSPLAEFYLRHALAGLPVEVSSAGTLDIGPADVPPEMTTVASAMGLDLSAHRARPLGSLKGENVDLILGMERHHVAAAVVDAGLPADKTFTLAELARLLGPLAPPDRTADPVADARAIVAAAAARRAAAPTFVPHEDVTDPFGRSKKTYQKVAGRVVELCNEVAHGLFGVAPPSVA
jgi:protein-tyrosine phosphatase